MDACASDCPPGELCSLYSQANGEDPIGTATPFDRCLIVELQPPWDRDVWQTSDFTRAIKRAVVQPPGSGPAIRLLAVQPDPEGYATEDEDPEWARVFWFTRPSQDLFRRYRHRQFHVPVAQLPEVAATLAQGGEPNGASHEVEEQEQRWELFLCTHSTRDACCGQFGREMYDQLRLTQSEGGDQGWRVWRCSHLGGHRLAPTLMEMNAGRSYGHLTPSALHTLLSPEQGNLEELLDCYRGWSGLQMYEQIVEREIWRQEGWAWAGQQCAGRTLEVRADKSARVEISCGAVGSGIQATYTAEVKVRDQVHTLNNSFTEKYFYANRFEVSDLEKHPA